MNYGRYFVLDNDASDLTRGIAVFNYRGVKYTKTDYRLCEPQDSADDTPKYPFYVTLTSEGVFFYVHYANYLGKEKDALLYHTNKEVLALPVLGVDTRGILSDILNNCYYMAFPANTEKNFLYDLVAAEINSSEDEFKGVTYSSLEVFDINYNKPKDQVRPPIVGFIRKMLLDFLFDMDHSNVFHNAVCYNNIHIKLNENFLFRAIRCKADYYYRRKQINIEIQPGVHPYDRAGEALLEAGYYSLAEEHWIDMIVSPEAEKMFHNSDWFSSVEDEMNRVFISGALEKTNKRARFFANLFDGKRTETCNDFLSKIEYEKGFSKACENNNFEFEKIKNRVIDSARQAASWYIRKYSFSGITKIWYGENYKWSNLAVISILLLVVFEILFSSNTEKTIGDQVVTQLSILFSIPVLWGIWRFLGKRGFIKTIGSVNALMPRLFASIVAAWFTLAIGEDLFKGFFDSKFKWEASFVLTIVLLVFVYYEISKINPYLELLKKIRRSFVLLLLAFIYSYTSGLLVVHFFGAQYLERSDYISEFYKNNVYKEVAEYQIDNNEKFVHDNFYKIISEYDAGMLSQISALVQDPYCVSDSLLRNAFVGPVSDTIVNPLSFTQNNIPYRLTLILVDAFNREENDFLKETHTKVIEGSVVNERLKNVQAMLDSIKGHYLQRADYNHFSYKDTAQLGKVWVNLLKTVDNNVLYRETLKELKDSHGNRVLEETKHGFLIFKDLLLQFTFFAMFIGIFLQLIFEDKSVTEPV